MTGLTEDPFDLLLDDEWDVDPVVEDGVIRDPEAILARLRASCWQPSPGWMKLTLTNKNADPSTSCRPCTSSSRGCWTRCVRRGTRPTRRRRPIRSGVGGHSATTVGISGSSWRSLRRAATDRHR
jgi:hypothetical protein